MIASGYDLGQYLLSCGLLDGNAVVTGDLRIVEATRRNHLFRVIRNNGPCYFVKHAASDEGRSYLGHEADLYRLISTGERLSSAHPYFPAYHSYDAEFGTLVLRLLSGFQNLLDYHQSLGRFPVSVAHRLGGALRCIHNATAVPGPGEFLQSGFATEPVWVLSIHRPTLQVLDTLSSASIELIKVIQRNPELGTALAALDREWLPSCLTHRDLSWENVMATDTELKIVDWEFAGLGDPFWDVGSVLASYLTFWVDSMPFEAGPAEMADHARYPVEDMQPAIAAFWQAYFGASPAKATGGQEAFLKAVRYCAARLLEIAYGDSQVSQAVNSRSLALTQLSLNLFRQPEQSMTEVFGVRLPAHQGE